MRVLLLLGLLPGCIWSKHVHDYTIELDGPAALEVSIVTAQGMAEVLAQGSDRGTLVVDGVPITAVRDADGVHLEAEKALGPLRLVDAYGKVGTLSRDNATVRPGEPVVLWHNFVFGRMDGLQYDATAYVMVQSTADWSHVKRIDARQHPNRTVGWAMWTAELGLLVASQRLAADGKKGAAAALFVPMGVLGWWGLGQIVGPRRDVQVYPEVTP